MTQTQFIVYKDGKYFIYPDPRLYVSVTSSGWRFDSLHFYPHDYLEEIISKHPQSVFVVMSFDQYLDQGNTALQQSKN